MGLKEDQPGFSEPAFSVTPSGSYRHANGQWMLRLRVVGSLQLPDGRQLVVNRTIKMPATQRGRRPRRQRAGV